MAHYTAYAVMTIDGKIAKNPNHFSDWASKEDWEHFQASLEKHDVFIVGSNTFNTAKEHLLKRNTIVLTRKVESVKESDGLVRLNLDKKDLDAYIKEKGYKEPAILGGTQVYTALIGLMDDLYLTVEPIVFGKGLPLFDGKDIEQRFILVSEKKLNDKGTLLFHYRKEQ